MSNRRGAISVIGTFMSLFLVGSIWYVMGIGDSILYRERVQDAADAVVFAGAVYHARGMNIIVTLNILMAALLGLVVLARLLRFLNDTAHVIGCGCIPVPFIGAACGSVCSVTSSAKAPLETLETSLTNLYNKLGPALSQTQRGVALAMPWIAELKAIGVAQTHGPDVKLGAIASISMVPLPGDDRLGLPVQEGDDAVLCGKVSDGMVDLVFAPIEKIPGIGLIKDWLESPLTGFVENFCGGGELVDPEKVAEIEKKEADEQVDKRCDWEQKVSAALAAPWLPLSTMTIEKARADHAEGLADLRKLQCYPLQKDALLAGLPEFGEYKNKPIPPEALEVPEVDFSGPGTPPPRESLGCSFNRAQCESRARAEIQSKQKAAREADAEGSVEIDPEARERTTPKIVYAPARNGDLYFQVWSIVYADDARAPKLAQGVEIAADGKKKAAALDLWSHLGWAQAEFYYDHEGPWTPEISRDEAMWNLRWRARLRRVTPPRVDLLEDWSGVLMGKILGRISSLIGGAPEDSEGIVEILVRFGFEEAGKRVEEVVHDAAVSGDDAIESEARKAWRRVGGVH